MNNFTNSLSLAKSCLRKLDELRVTSKAPIDMSNPSASLRIRLGDEIEIENTIDHMLSRLLGKGVNYFSSKDDVELMEYFNGLSEEERIDLAFYLPESSVKILQLPSDDRNLLSEYIKKALDINQAERLIKEGNLFLSETLGDPDKVIKELKDHTLQPEEQVVLKQIYRKKEQYNQIIEKCTSQIQSAEMTIEEFESLKKDYAELIEKDVHSLASKVTKDIPTIELVLKKREEIGSSLIRDIKSKSQITTEQATDWFNRSVKIDKKLTNALKKSGITAEIFQEQIQEFYILSNGKLKNLNFQPIRGSRAYASKINNLDGEVYLNAHDGKETLFHEMAHHLEIDPMAKKAALDFIKSRRESTKLYSLKALTGIPYGKSEVAYKDSFITPYVGKYYENGTSEVFSVGSQMFADPLKATILLEQDPEMYALVASYLVTPENSNLKQFKEAKLNDLLSANRNVRSRVDTIVNDTLNSIPKVEIKPNEELVQVLKRSWILGPDDKVMGAISTEKNNSILVLYKGRGLSLKTNRMANGTKAVVVLLDENGVPSSCIKHSLVGCDEPYINYYLFSFQRTGKGALSQKSILDYAIESGSVS